MIYLIKMRKKKVYSTTKGMEIMALEMASVAAVVQMPVWSVEGEVSLVVEWDIVQ